MRGIGRVCVIGVLAVLTGCTSSSSPVAIPLAVPLIGSDAARERTYAGVLVRSHPGAGPALGWQLRNARSAGAVPLDVTTVLNIAERLVGQMVIVQAHSAAEPGGRLVLKADSLSTYTQ